ncbi:hypothetical protein RHGRI_015364 [Rhododendron griersonianum]|uniref:laccase n=1 Tax=Rhododendron griersonianum TaxID=479676 RepID=A0AAV6KDI9_9ERIC|nr:hypothetical protein RHGRI_015364 [Rhododendron griersonianum]
MAAGGRVFVVVMGGDCSGDGSGSDGGGTYKLKVVQGKTYLLRIINVALYSELFFKIANHTMTVVAVDACYTNPMVTNVIVISPGQTIDVLLTADQPLASYYMAAHCYDSLGDAYDETTTTVIITYENATPSTPLMPNLPAASDTSAAFKFYSSLTSLVNGPHWAPVPLKIDEEMFLTEGLGMVPCGANNTCGAPLGLQFAASMNNESFELPTKLSMLEASYYNLTAGIYTTDFPKYPSVVFDYTNISNNLNKALVMTSRSTKVTKLKYNSTVEIVFQNTVGEQSHPIHLHGYNFYVLAQGFGNYNPITGPKVFNLVNPLKRNTVGVPVAGWTVIRFTANNPGGGGGGGNDNGKMFVVVVGGDCSDDSSGRGSGGEWWNANIIDVENQALADGHGPNVSDAFTINGWPGDLYNCSSTGTYKLKVVQGVTYLLRIINVALNNELFFKIANHTMTVVAVDACYTNPMVTDVIVITPGQTIDVLLTANQPPASYYMAAHAYDSLGANFDKTTTRGIITYGNAASSTAPMPTLPAFNDTPMAFKLYSSLTSLVNGPHWAPVPLKVDNYMFVTEGLSVVPCEANNTCGAPFGLAFAASMNNESFELPTKLSMLEAFYYNLTAGIYTADFPSYPPVAFDYTSLSNKLNATLMMTSRSTRVTKLKFNSTVQIVFQNTALLGQQSHPIHLHGFNFYVLAQGFGNYDAVTGPEIFNLINPQRRNTVGVPVGGWTAIRFTANNPGMFSLLYL